jgi:hypothetical protein
MPWQLAFSTLSHVTVPKSEVLSFKSQNFTLYFNSASLLNKHFLIYLYICLTLALQTLIWFNYSCFLSPSSFMGHCLSARVVNLLITPAEITAYFFFCLAPTAQRWPWPSHS